MTQANSTEVGCDTGVVQVRIKARVNIAAVHSGPYEGYFDRGSHRGAGVAGSPAQCNANP